MKNIFTILFALNFVFIFVSCDSGNNSGSEGYSDQEIIEMLQGKWVESNPSCPFTSVISFLSDMTATNYDDYAMTSISSSGATWDVKNGKMIINGYSYDLEIINNNTFIADDDSFLNTMYRISTETDIFNTTPIDLIVGTPLIKTINYFDVQYFKVSVTSGTTYVLSWDDEDGSGTYTSNIHVSVFDSNKTLADAYIQDKDLGYEDSDKVTITPDENILYIVIENQYDNDAYQISIVEQ